MSELIGRLTGHHANPKIAELMRLPLFANVPRRELAIIAANLDEARAEAGETLIRENHLMRPHARRRQRRDAVQEIFLPL